MIEGEEQLPSEEEPHRPGLFRVAMELVTEAS